MRQKKTVSDENQVTVETSRTNGDNDCLFQDKDLHNLVSRDIWTEMMHIATMESKYED